MDVDVGGGPSDNEGEAENYGYQGPMSSVTRDADSDDIVWQLERALPRWEGFGDKGWLEGFDLVCLPVPGVPVLKYHSTFIVGSLL